MTSTTEVEALPIPAATTADCGLCATKGKRSEMTYDGLDWFCGAESPDPDGKAAYVAAVAACTERWLASPACVQLAVEPAQQAAEPVQETAADQDAEAGPAAAPAAAQDAPEATELGANT